MNAPLERKAAVTSKRLSLPKAILIILLVEAIALTVGIALGYKYFWPRYKGPDRWAIEVARWQQVVLKNPTDVSGWVQLGYTFFQKGDYAQAEKAYRQAMKLDPMAVEVSYYLGEVMLKQRRFKDAEDMFSRAIAREPSNPLPYYGLAEVYYEQGLYDQALEKLNYIIGVIDPTLTDVLHLRGLVYLKKGERKNAAASFREALRFDPGFEKSRDELLKLGVSEEDLPPRPAYHPERISGPYSPGEIGPSHAIPPGKKGEGR